MMGACDPMIRERVYEYWRNIHQGVGERIEQIAAEAEVRESDGGTPQVESLGESRSDLVGSHR